MNVEDDTLTLDVSRDAKLDHKRLSAADYRDKYEKIFKVHWSNKQREFINLPGKCGYFRAGNQSGKSFALAGLITYVALGRYPSSYTGWKPKERKDGAFSVVIWVIAPTSQMARDGLQSHLLGDVAGAQVGTGLIPKDSIVSVNASRGIAGAVDYAVIRRDDGTLACIRFKTFEQGRSALQAESVSLVAIDELLDDEAIFNELIARTTVTNGRIRLAATERLQSSPVAAYFKENANDDVLTITGSLDDADHLSQEEKHAILNSYKSETERKTRYYGLPWEGGGSVFKTPLFDLLEDMDPSLFPLYNKYLGAVDFSHFGTSETSSQFAFVALAVDPYTKVVRVFDAFKMRGLVESHALKIRQAGLINLRIAWPHDGLEGTALGSNIADLYRQAGLNMMTEHATFVSGGYNFESGIELMNSLLSTGRLKVASHLKDWLTEYGMYERDEDGKVIKRADDLMSATRIGCKLRLAAIPLALIGLYGAATATSFDIAIDSAGDAVAVRGADGALSVIGRRPSSFTVEQWLTADADARDPRQAIDTGACDRIGCVGILADGRSVALVLDEAAFAEDCVRADLVVTPLYAPPGCAASLVIDRDRLRQTGAMVLTARRAGWTIVTARTADEDRPWSPAPAQLWPAPAKIDDELRAATPP